MDNLLTLILAVLLAGVGGAILAALCTLLFNAGRGSFFGAQGKKKHHRGAATLAKADALIAEDKWFDAARELSKSVIFDNPQRRDQIAQLSDHHQNILSRLLLICEHTSRRAANIATLERLFLERCELQLLQLKSNESYAKLKSRRGESGKGIPDWSKTDYRRRIAETAARLAGNKRELQEELRRLFSELAASPAGEEIVYH